ncbi:MAG: 4-alpha-glucanotransferase [Lachnospiraceae bacterium]|nr:4-alpha-glucanotransferase [Lachnospiraceae bacterium]
MRRCGILMPIFSLPSKYGIGTFSKEAYEFVDFLKAAGQSLWQILPLGPTGYGDSPYQSFSTFAGNPYFIDVDEFVKEGYVTEADCKKYACKDTAYVDYEDMYKKRFKLLRKAFENSNVKALKAYKNFVKDNEFWLDDYALFMAIKDEKGGIAWTEWEEDLKLRKAKALDSAKKRLAGEIDFYKFQQFYFNKQWKALKKYANDSGVEIVGDIPIYVAFDSADVWASPKLFDLNEENIPNAVAGCPPDPFAPTGQLWGNPLYRWDVHRESGYAWWIKRIAYCFDLYDVVRIDHFRGFDAFYAIPFTDKTAENGKWRKGPGYDLFKAINNALGEKQIIAEDLGFLTDSVRRLVKRTGYPGMKIMQFAFGSGAGNEYLPHNLSSNSVIYTGTHDNETVRGWYERMLKDDKKCAEYVRFYAREEDSEKMAWALIELCYKSVCDTVIIPMQDFLNIGAEGRINTPAVLGGNWQWRMKKSACTKKLAKEIDKLRKLCLR